MNKICTDIEQSKKLIELGIDINTVDMCWADDTPDLPILIAYPITDCDNLENKIPAWSLTALLELIPAGNILLRDALSKNYKCINTVDSDLYDNPLDAAFQMVCWLKENGKI